MNKLAFRALGVAVTLAAGCAADVAPSSEDTASGLRQGLDISRHDAQAFEGSFVDANATITFKAWAQANEQAVLELSINGKSLGYEALAATNAHNGWYSVDADVVLTQADKAGAQAALDALVDVLGNDTTAMTLFEASVPKMTSFLASQGVGVQVASLHRNEYSAHVPAFRSINDDGLVCIKKTTTIKASYDLGTSGTEYSESVVVGSNWGKSACNAGDYSCMGRCGAGCNGFGGGWTLDCLEHDVCSQRLCASGGSSDPNCGDEYNYASSDIFSSCSGN